MPGGKMKKASAFVPAHISGFFQPHWAKDPARSGSRNCGPCLGVGVRTDVEVQNSDRASLGVYIDGKRAADANTTKSVVEQLLATTQKYKIKVNHTCQVPVGAGYGASGAGALGTSVALSKALGMRLSRNEIIRAAHVAEVKCRTGLGDVGAQAFGGLVIGVKPGAPPYGEWKKIAVPQDVKVICATLGPLSTKSLLGDEKFKRRASTLGRKAVEELLKEPTVFRFISASREFAEELGLIDAEIESIIQAAEAAGAIGASQAMLGRAMFAVVQEKNIELIRRALLEILSPGQLMISGIYPDRQKITIT
jgi:pantoate kinase